MLASGYRGPLSLEIFNDEFRAAPARQNALEGLPSLIHDEAEAGFGPGLPAAPVCRGVEFLEFAVDAAAREKLSTLLGSLGFRHAGRHRSKDVDLYRQGGVNLVLNSEEDSAASEHFQMHGPSVCAMAFTVDDAARTVARAEALRCVLWRERVGDGERRIPALRAPDGTLIYLVDDKDARRSIWEDDFHLFAEEPAGRTSDTPSPPIPLLGIDHVAQALPFGRMDSFVLFYRTVFGFVPESLWELPDPYGLIRSRALVSPDADPGHGVRLPLNISESRRTATGRFVSATSGAGVHHIAFATADADRLVKDRLAAGAPFLPIPANYYDDLAVKHPLDDAMLAALKERELLYDRDEQGEFLHAYTDSFDDRFFFEMVERRGGYRQFGAVNAAVRMAVQAQLREGARPELYLD
ncbi:4-hydroxyphenylpyruvate dioxygenase family protein [Azospirillum sp. B506]|uniref:4-hydroxyphenylpyruvate dioxygenase family protein n=1 Tax=Azospirillum sp. B506 TaxID=137721 RepID=UPI000349F862|nr:VOC family protein [Azospirillum sp. B506]